MEQSYRLDINYFFISRERSILDYLHKLISVYFYCCTVHVVTIIFIVAPYMLLRLFLLLQLMHTLTHFKNTNSH